MRELYHYGTKEHSGRYRWGSGERPYQRLENPIHKNVSMKKGDMLFRVTGTPSEKRSNKPVYTTRDYNDMAVYAVRALSVKKRDNLKTKAYTVVYEAKNNLSIAGEKAIRKALRDSLDKVDDKTLVFSYLGKEYAKLLSSDSIRRRAGVIRRRVGTPHTMGDESLGEMVDHLIKHDSSISKRFIKNLEKQGYHGIHDLYDRGNWSVTPTIIFNRKYLRKKSIYDLDGTNYERLYKEAEDHMNAWALRTKLKDIANSYRMFG